MTLSRHSQLLGMKVKMEDTALEGRCRGVWQVFQCMCLFLFSNFLSNCFFFFSFCFSFPLILSFRLVSYVHCRCQSLLLFLDFFRFYLPLQFLVSSQLKRHFIFTFIGASCDVILCTYCGYIIMYIEIVENDCVYMYVCMVQQYYVILVCMYMYYVQNGQLVV